MCALVKEKVADFFQLPQFGVACPFGSEKVVHGPMKFIGKHWGNEDFFVNKVDMWNALNIVSRPFLPSECAIYFPKLFPWASWCYDIQPLLWNPVGHLSFKAGVQQGDPLGPMLSALVRRVHRALLPCCQPKHRHLGWYKRLMQSSSGSIAEAILNN